MVTSPRPEQISVHALADLAYNGLCNSNAFCEAMTDDVPKITRTAFPATHYVMTLKDGRKIKLTVSEEL